MKHSVTIEPALCRGCTSCIKGCPTQAIRVRNGKAAVLDERCIDCGRCIQVCPHLAIQSGSDSLDDLSRYRYTVALPEPALYGQFRNIEQVDIILNGLLKLGFDRVFEVGKAAELISDYARQRLPLAHNRPTPQISSGCPTVVRLIRMRFPRLLSHIVPIVTPVELAAILAREEAVAATGLAPEEIGVFSIIPCPSKVTAAHAPETLCAPVIDGALAIRDVYRALLTCMDSDDLAPLSSCGAAGVGWAFSGGESAARHDENSVAVDGVKNVVRVLEEIEDGRFPETDFIELYSCVQGCVGGCLTAENPFAAHSQLKRIMKNLPPSRNRFDPTPARIAQLSFARSPEYMPVFVLDEDRATAFEKLLTIEKLKKALPGLNCGSCGAPSCHALAEDIVLGRASEEDCIFRVRQRMQYIVGSSDADDYLPPPFRGRKKGAPPSGGRGEGGPLP